MKIKLVVVSVMLAGCASMNQPDPNIPDNVKLSSPEAYNAQYIESIIFPLESKHLAGNPGKCVSLVVNNNEYTLTDQSKSFVGSYTGNYYNVESQKEVGGGQSLIYHDRTTAISKGNKDGTYTFGLVTITKIVSFKVEVNTDPSKRKVVFTDIKAAQQETGSATNSGFTRVGAWSGAKPVFVHDLLEKISNELKTCLSD